MPSLNGLYIQIVQDITITTIKKCEEIFATCGVPKVFVSDNGRSFISHEFQNFFKQYGIIHKLSAPFHPATNGQAERFIQTFKNALKRMMMVKNTNIHSALQKLLLQYRSMPHATTGKSSAELLFGRKLHIKLDLIRPYDSKGIFARSVSSPVIVNFKEGERVSCRNYVGTRK